MKIIDFNCAVGYKTINYEVVNHENFKVQEKVKMARNAEELLAELDFCGIYGAVVSHNAMVEVDPDYGNRLVLQETAQAPDRLLPSWTILPPITEPHFAPEKLFPAMKAQGIKLLRAYPERNRYMLNEAAMGDILSAIETQRIPLFLSPSEGWESIYGVLKEFPSLTVVLSNYGLWSHARYTFPLLKRYPNFHIETGDMQTAGEIREICRTFGSERLLFGTNFPANGMGGPLATLLGSGLPADQMENIAWNNAMRLLNGVRA